MLGRLDRDRLTDRIRGWGGKLDIGSDKISTDLGDRKQLLSIAHLTDLRVSMVHAGALELRKLESKETDVK
jgi:hypothetical protein